MDRTELFRAAGFHFESFLGVYMKSANGRTATVADGPSINAIAYEVQVTTDDGVFIDGSADDETIESAIAFADRILCPASVSA